MRKPTVAESPSIPRTAVTLDQPGAGAAPRQSRVTEQQMRSHVHYLGCRITEDGREYTLRAPSRSQHLFVLFIAHRHFASGQARFQDGPDLCCAKVTRVLMDETEESAADRRLVFSAEELLEYRNGRTPPSDRKRTRRRAATDSGN
jgi:hypothetical protein